MVAGTTARALSVAFIVVAGAVAAVQPLGANARTQNVATFKGHFKGSFILSIQGTTAEGTIAARGRTSALGRSVMHAKASGPAVLFGCTKVTGSGHVKGQKRSQVSYSFQVQFCLGASHDTGTFTLTKGGGAMDGVRGSGKFVLSPAGVTNPIPVTLDLSGKYRLPRHG